MTLWQWVAMVCAECGLGREEAVNESFGWLKMRLAAERRKRAGELMELLQVVGAGAGTPYGGKGYKSVIGALEKRLQSK